MVTEAPLAAEPSVAELVERASGGDRRAEALLCFRFAPAVRAFARRRLRGDDAVEELAQDVMVLFIDALRARRVDEPARVGGFLLGICRNVARERARSRDRRADLWARYGETLAVLETDAPERSPYELAHLEDCVSQLGGKARDVIRSAYVDGASNGEIAARLSMTEGNVRVVRHRALAALRRCMSSRAITWEMAS